MPTPANAIVTFETLDPKHQINSLTLRDRNDPIDVTVSNLHGNLGVVVEDRNTHQKKTLQPGSEAFDEVVALARKALDPKTDEPDTQEGIIALVEAAGRINPGLNYNYDYRDGKAVGKHAGAMPGDLKKFGVAR